MFNSSYETTIRRKGIPDGVSSGLQNLHAFSEAEMALSFIVHEVVTPNAQLVDQKTLDLALLKIAPKERLDALKAITNKMNTNHPNAERCSFALIYVEQEKNGDPDWERPLNELYFSSSYSEMWNRGGETNNSWEVQ